MHSNVVEIAHRLKALNDNIKDAELKNCIGDLMNELGDLKIEIVALKEQNADLRQQLSDLQKSNTVQMTVRDGVRFPSNREIHLPSLQGLIWW